MQDTEKINYDKDYPLLFDGRLMGYDTDTQGFEYLYEMLPYFVTTEITSKRREWGELGRLLDNTYLTYKEPCEFLKFFYEAFYPLHLQSVKYKPLTYGINIVTLSLVTDYVIDWLAEKMESTAVNNDTENGLVIRGMYETLRPRVTPTHQAEVKGYKLGYTDTQLETLHHELIKGKFLDENTPLENFKNAFNDKVLAEGFSFKPLKWTNPTMGAVFFFHVKKTKNVEWTKYSYLFEPANYKQLLSQSRQNGTFENLINTLENIIL